MWPKKPYTKARGLAGKRHRSKKYRAGLCVFGGCQLPRDGTNCRCATHRELNRQQCAARRQRTAGAAN